MELLSTEDYSLWDPSVDPQLPADFLDFDYLRNDWVKPDEGDKLILDAKADTLTQDDEHLLLDADFELANWMETKFDFENGAFQFNSLEDIDLLLQQEEESPDKEETCSHDCQITDPESCSSSNSSTPTLEFSAEVNESEMIIIPPIINQIEIEIVKEEKEKSVSKAQPKPYDRPTSNKSKTSDLRKSRKRTQNRNAATRYRSKKREEADTLAAEEERLQGINEELKNRMNDLTNEIKYLKGLYKEVHAKSK